VASIVGEWCCGESLNQSSKEAHLRVTRIILAAAALALVTTVSPFAATHVITVQDNTQFTPNALQIEQGDFVRWEHVGAVMNHTTTNGLGLADPNAGLLWDAPLMSGTSFTYQFNDAGTYPFFCRPHVGLGMTGEIVVAHSVPSSDLYGKVGLLVLLGLVGGMAIWRRHVSAFQR
jgi:plastocyanin